MSNAAYAPCRERSLAQLMMSALRTVVLFLPLSVCCNLQLFADLVTIEFEGVAPAGGISSVPITPYSEAGFRFTASRLTAIFASDAEYRGFVFNSNGTDFLGFNTANVVTLTQTDGNPFTLISLDASNLNVGQGLGTFKVMGHLSGGGTLILHITPDLDSYTTTTFPATWTNLTSVDFFNPGGNENGSLDNIVVDGGFSVPDNISASIALEIDSIAHFISYDIKDSMVRSEPSEKFEVELVDEFQTHTFTVKNRVSILNPVDQEGEGITDPSAVLTAYKVKQLKHEWEPRPEKMPITGVTIQDYLFPEGIVVDIDDVNKADRLLVPASMSLMGPPPPLDDDSHNLDHLLCYKVRLPHGTEFPKDIPVNLTDRFIDPEDTGVTQLFDVGKPRRLCNPVDMSGEGFENPDNYLLCYDIKRPKGDPKHARTAIFLDDPFVDAGSWETRKERELCFPAVLP